MPVLGPFDIQVGGHKDAIKAGKTPNLNSLLQLMRPRSASRVVYAYLKGRRNIASIVNMGIKAAYVRKLGNDPAHATAARIRDVYPKEWNSYYKFCVVRNPFDRLVSDYFWRTRGMKERPSFSDMVDAIYRSDRLEGLAPLIPDNWPIYTIDDRIAVDRVIRYENLEAELADVLDHLGITLKEGIPRVKSHYRRGAGYRSFYTEEDVRKVEERFKSEILAFGYSF